MSMQLARYSGPPVAQAETDATLIELWLHGRPQTTYETYAIYSERFLAYVKKPLQQITLRDLQRFSDTLECYAPASKATMLACVKSLLSFAHRLGYLPFDVGRALRLPTVRDGLVERILTEEEVHLIITLEPDPRNRILLRLLYVCGIRVTEVAILKWSDLRERQDGGQITVFGKGGKTRAILVPAGLWADLLAMRNGARNTDPVFRSEKTGRHLTKHALWGIVKRAGVRAGVNNGISPHWLRHSHASHALDNGAPIHLVQATMGHASVSTTSRYLHARPNESSSRFVQDSPSNGTAAAAPPERYIGERVREARRARGVSVTELAKELGVSAPYVYQLESGWSKPSREVVEKLENWLAG
jgi:integrase/recombinase XerD